MKLSSLERVFNALNAAEVRFLVVGGVAVNAFGYVRLTQDLDLVVRLAQENLRRCIDVLKQLQYKPVLPVDIEDFLDDLMHLKWIHEERHGETEKK